MGDWGKNPIVQKSCIGAAWLLNRILLEKLELNCDVVLSIVGQMQLVDKLRPLVMGKEV